MDANRASCEASWAEADIPLISETALDFVSSLAAMRVRRRLGGGCWLARGGCAALAAALPAPATLASRSGRARVLRNAATLAEVPVPSYSVR